MRCPTCDSEHLQVVDSRDTPEAVRRRRQCENGHRFTTYERREVFACPRCGQDDSRIEVVELDAGGVRRQRRCGECGHVYGTEERAARTDVSVIKADGRREPFNRDKLFRALRTAVTKRPVSIEHIQAAVDAIQSELGDEGRAEVTSSRIAAMALERLVELDEVAYVRFASSYLEAGGIDRMQEVIEETLRRRELRSIRRTHVPLVPDEVEMSG